MSTGRASPRGFARFARWDRALALGWLTFSLLVFGAFALHPVRRPILDGVQRGLDYWDDRWSRRVAHGEELERAGRSDAALAYLEALDAAFPARHVKQRRDMERERVLRALARIYESQGRKRRTLDTYAELVAFDPRNFESRALYADALLRFAEPAAALEELRQVLLIHPGYAPSLAAVARLHFERGDFAGVVSAYEAYLDAFVAERVGLQVGGNLVWARVPVDGRFHDVSFRVVQPVADDVELVLLPGPLPWELASLEVYGPLRVGVAGERAHRVLHEQDAEPRRLSGGEWRVRSGLGATDLPHGVERVEMRVRLFKELEPATWEMVEGSYRNLLAWERLERARERTFGTAGDGPAEGPGDL